MSNIDIPQQIGLPIHSFPDGPVPTKETDPQIIAGLQDESFVAGSKVFDNQRNGAVILRHITQAWVSGELELSDPFIGILGDVLLGSGVEHLKEQLWRGAEPVINRAIDLPWLYDAERGMSQDPLVVLARAYGTITPLELYTARAARQHRKGGITRETHHDIGYGASHAALHLWSVNVARKIKAENRQAITEADLQTEVKFSCNDAINAARKTGWTHGAMLTLAAFGDRDSELAGRLRSKPVGSTKELQMLKELWASGPDLRQAMRSVA